MYRIEYTDRLMGWTKSVSVYTEAEAKFLWIGGWPEWASQMELFGPDGISLNWVGE